MSAINFVLVTILILLSINLLGLVISLISIHSKNLHKFRRQDKKIYPSIFYNRLPLIGFNILSLSLLSSFGLYFLFPLFNKSMDFDILPILLQLFIILFVDDLFFYFLHRWLHENKFLLKTIHRIHHKATAPFALEYLYVHPLEWMLGYIGPFIGIISIGVFTDSLSIWTLWIYMFVRNMHELDVHSGYKSKIDKWIPFWGDNDHHDIHHEKLDGNYATTFTLWDHVFKTKMKKEN